MKQNKVIDTDEPTLQVNAASDDLQRKVSLKQELSITSINNSIDRLQIDLGAPGPVSNVSPLVTNYPQRDFEFSNLQPPSTMESAGPKSPLPCFAVEEIENIFISMRDGTRLAARLWLPKSENAIQRYPGILEFIPYGKRHGTAYRDEVNYGYIARFGFGCCRVDLRGSGESEGILKDEYLKQEHEDAEDCIAWIAKQDWCTGNVGMTGISWGGFNALQVAARRPPNLKGILPLCATHNRYTTDVHYAGGLMMTDNISWAAFMITLLGCPPDPALVGHLNWRTMWNQRLSQVSPWLHQWTEHQSYDDFWKHGSICEDYSAIQCPILTASGWADGYCNSVPALLENIKPKDPKVLVLGINGPWAHNLPHLARPGPSMDWLAETVKWWNYCLKGDEEMAEEWRRVPKYTAFMPESEDPTIILEHRQGRWVSEKNWPSQHIQMTPFYLTHARTLATDMGSVQPRIFGKFTSPLSTGIDCGRLGYGGDPDNPVDQRHEDANSLCFDSPVLSDRLEILGAPIVRLNLSCSAKVGMIAVRLCDVDPQTKSSVYVCHGVLNLNHMHSHERPFELEPGKVYSNIEVKLDQIAHAFPAGHRIRIGISTSFWPFVWPSPSPASISLHTIFSGENNDSSVFSQLLLPLRPHPETIAAVIENQPHSAVFYRTPQQASPVERTNLREGKTGTRHVLTDYHTGERKLILKKDYGLVRDETNGIEHDECVEETYTIKDPKHQSEKCDTLSAKVEIKYVIEVGRKKEWIERLLRENRYSELTEKEPISDWRVRIETNTLFTSTETHFRIQTWFSASELKDNEYVEVDRKSWDTLVERKFI